MALLIAVAIVGLGMLGGSNAFAAPQRTAGNNSQPIRGSGSCNWGGYYANNECVWYEIDDAQGLPHNHCKVCKNGQWHDLYQCERRCFKNQ
jgi:hypothetical protein